MTSLKLLEKIAALLESSKPSKEVMNAKEAAAYLGIGESNLWDLKLAYKIPFTILSDGRIAFRKSVLDKWMDERTICSADQHREFLDGRRKAA